MDAPRARHALPGFHPSRGSLVSQGRDVAQPGSALAWGASGRRFKSGRPDQFIAATDQGGITDPTEQEALGNEILNVKMPGSSAKVAEWADAPDLGTPKGPNPGDPTKESA